MATNSREISGAPPLGTTLAIAAGVLVAVLALKVLQPWLERQARSAHITCAAPSAADEVRLVYLTRRAGRTEAECGPIVGGQPQRKRR